MQAQKVLIANRGEIACRVIKTARRLGYETVAIYSDADRDALHVSLADACEYVGGAQAQQSYLNQAEILNAARRCGATAIHPGYGFLSENADFVELCEANGIVFIGPPAEVIRTMGDKSRAKQQMEEAGVPCVPGWSGEDQSEQSILDGAAKVDYPLLVKAVAGGGGRGMRKVYRAEELPAALGSAQQEAMSAFGDSTVMLEQFLEDARHIEIQVFVDEFDNAVHFFERDCSTQRKHQKIIEEAPSPVVTQEMRMQMGAAATTAALAVGYRGAGTVEFVVDKDMNFYFLEMNTRLQVEHPVTELVTGVDLVEWQLLVAFGKPLPLAQEDIAIRGWAIEARLCAEDPYADFRPATGHIGVWQAADIADVRYDMGIRSADKVSVYYDSMLGKIIALGSNREDASHRLVRALTQSILLGVTSNASFLLRLLQSEAFLEARITTAQIDEWAKQGDPILEAPPVGPAFWVSAAAIKCRCADGAWFSSSGIRESLLELMHAGEVKTVLIANENGQFYARIENKTYEFTARNQSPGQLLVNLDGTTYTVAHASIGTELHISINGRNVDFAEPQIEQGNGGETDQHVRSPVSGLVTEVMVAVGDSIDIEQVVAKVEAMKMVLPVVSSTNGKVSELNVKQGQQVEAGAVMALVESLESPANG